MTTLLERPIPWLSANNVEFICKKMENGFDYCVEYGMGASTLYFMDRCEQSHGVLISVENNAGWFNRTIDRVKNRFRVADISERVVRLSVEEIYALIQKMDSAQGRVPENLSRLKKFKEFLLLGPFYRFSPFSGSRLAGKLPLWSFSRSLLLKAAHIAYILKPNLRPANVEFKGRIQNLSIILRCVPPSIKDQFGESPTKSDYVDAGLSDIKKDLKAQKTVKAVFVIDGGPRGEIVRAILELEATHRNFHPIIFLCDAHQAIFKEVTQGRPSGTFLPGTNLTLSGDIVQEDPRGSDEVIQYMFGKTHVTKEELAKKEVWYYEPLS